MYNEIWNTSEEILSWEPIEEQWWITGFNPYTVGEADVKKQVMISSVDFSKFGSIVAKNDVYQKAKYAISNLKRESRYVIFDDSNMTMWLMWYGESKR